MMNIKSLSIKKVMIFICVVVLILSSVLLVVFLKKATPSETFSSYKQYFEKQDFKSMYSLLSLDSKSKITEDNFTAKYQNIYNGIEARNVKVTAGSIDKIKPDKNGKITIPFSVDIDTLAGNIKIPQYKMSLTEEKINNKNKWMIDWSEKLIFPDLESTDKVKVTILNPKRGEISDRNGKGLAVNGTINTIGIVPSKFNAIKDKMLPEIAQILDISQVKIASKLTGQNNANMFVPIVNLSTADKDKATKLTAIDGVQYQKSQGRLYPGDEALGSLIGYTGPITAEELVSHKGQGYSSQDKIGKMGLEQVYEKRLKGQKGAEIYIAKGGQNNSKKLILRKEAKNGENIKLSIDFDVQKKIYDEMKGDAGAAAAINPKTGEILALVSSPSINPNLYTTYIPDTVKKEWDSAAKSPYINRFKAVYAPGSTFKLVTGAIGLKTGKIKPTEAIDIKGKQWQPNASWGNNKITRVDDIGKPVNLQNAYIYSDNIYFAMKALNIGKDSFTNEAKNFGIGETLPIDYPMSKSQLSNSGINSDQMLANTGFGQGQVLLNPLNVAMIYSSLANNGDIMAPVLEIKKSITPKIWKGRAILPQYVKTLSDDLVQVIENPSGTGYTTQAGSIKLLGKTGTAELKKDKNDITAEENGWFVAMNVDNPRLDIAMIIEDVKARGESHYVVPIVKSIFDSSLK
jgi:penicillin-binding protein 3